MTDRIAQPKTLIDSVDALVAGFFAGAKPRAQWRMGAEHEKIGVVAADSAPLPYHGPRGIAALFERLIARGWSPVREGQEVVALARDAAKITLEPGGQLELSGDPVAGMGDVRHEIVAHLEELA